MKRVLLGILLVLATTLAMPQQSAAQSTKSTTKNQKKADRKSNNFMSFSFDVRGGSAIAREYRNYSFLDIDASYGYHFNDRWSIHIPLTASTGLFYPSKAFMEQIYLGIGGEFKITQHKEWGLILAPKVQSTLGDKWGAMAYDLALKMESKGVPVNVGMGVRFIDTYTSPIAESPIADKVCVYFTIGIRLKSK